MQPTYQGTTNTTYFIHTPVGKFLLKFYGDSTPTAQIDYEHSLLSYLQEADLSFAVPTPIPASSGETLVHLHKDDAFLRVALISLIPGQHAERHNLQHVRAAGRALGELHDAFSPTSPNWTRSSSRMRTSWSGSRELKPSVS
ncbi:MAG: phosphotransferase, partial [Chroococcidiopsidaceae cyanobacterium CP_BM_RX_35]|nr:phosphotransferase [Chroococcidiopsidaceae cyanobacterium CP_BM_RX_35]